MTLNIGRYLIHHELLLVRNDGSQPFLFTLVDDLDQLVTESTMVVAHLLMFIMIRLLPDGDC